MPPWMNHLNPVFLYCVLGDFQTSLRSDYSNESRNYFWTNQSSLFLLMRMVWLSLSEDNRKIKVWEKQIFQGLLVLFSIYLFLDSEICINRLKKITRYCSIIQNLTIFLWEIIDLFTFFLVSEQIENL